MRQFRDGFHVESILFSSESIFSSARSAGTPFRYETTSRRVSTFLPQSSEVHRNVIFGDHLMLVIFLYNIIMAQFSGAQKISPVAESKRATSLAASMYSPMDGGSCWRKLQTAWPGWIRQREYVHKERMTTLLTRTEILLIFSVLSFLDCKIPFDFELSQGTYTANKEKIK